MPIYWHIIFIAVAYLFGGILTGYYLVRLRTAEDVRLIGSGSAGARNVGRHLGKTGFVITLIGDALKGAVVTSLALWADVGPVITQLLLLALVAGHIWPLHLGFRGGKGISPALGGLLVLDVTLTLMALMAAGGLWLMTRHKTLSGLLTTALLPLGALALDRPQTEIYGVLLLALLILFAHRQNIVDILKPSE